MQIKKYCVIALVSEEMSTLIKDDIISIANEAIKHTRVRGNFITTFTSAFEINEIKELLSRENKFMFFLFEINKENTNLICDLPLSVKNHLFDKTEEYNKFDNYINVESETINHLEKYNDLNEDERMLVIDNIFDKGFENITKKDKEILNYLTNKTEILTIK